MNPLIAGLFANFKASEELGGLPEDDAFELFVAAQVLPDDLLEQVQTTDLLLDASTIGIDLAALEINGALVWDVDDVDDLCGPTSKIEVTVHLAQVKRSPNVDSAQVLALGTVATKFLNNEGLQQHPKLKALMESLRRVFSDYAAKLKAAPAVNVYYACTAPPIAVADSTVADRAATARGAIEALGFVGNVQFVVWGTDELHGAWSRKNQANEVELQLEKQVNLPKMPSIDQAILGVVAATELLKLVEGQDGNLDERVFYDNVRGFKGEDNPVNRQILETLTTPESQLLPVLNNGVTVVARAYQPKPGDAISISDFQIVNGCQTSHCLHQAKEAIVASESPIFVPIRLVVTQDDEVATRIIRATNSQTAVLENDLVALTKFQKQLEDFYRLDQADVKLAYERRSGQFYAADVIKTRVVTISDQMRAVTAVMLDSPHAAARYTGKLYDEVGATIFRENHKLLPYVASAFAAYRIENAFRTGLDPALKPGRYHILTTVKYQILGGPSAALDSNQIETQSRTLIDVLKAPDHVALFQTAAEKVLQAGDGQLPTADRLKRQPFTAELITKLVVDAVPADDQVLQK
jgi:hypothetical protein